MSNKNSKTFTVGELRESLQKQLKDWAAKLDSHDRMRIAINLKIELVTVKRYMDGKPEEMRNLELAEQIINEAEKVFNAKAEGAVM
jgi:hypothetical protein